MATVIVREDFALQVECEFCHLGSDEAVAVLHHRLRRRQTTQACRTCTARMGAEVTRQMHGRKSS